MGQAGSGRERARGALRGVTELPELLGERRFRASIGRGKKGQGANLGLYPTRWLAAFAYNVATEALSGGRGVGHEIPESEQPTAEEVREITARVRRRLGLAGAPSKVAYHPPSADQVRTLFEVTVVGFWRQQAGGHGGNAGQALDLAAARLVEAAEVLFWRGVPEGYSPLEVMESLLGLRLDRAFRRADLTRAVLDDDSDDAFRLARWLVHPDDLPGGGGFREAVGRLYGDVLGAAAGRSSAPGWATILGVEPPFNTRQVRAAYRTLSKAAHPDIGGSHSEFVRLRKAYEEARRYCEANGL